MPESNAMPALKCPRLKKGILHASNLFLHRFQRLPDDGRPHTLSTQVAHFLNLDKIEERIVLARSN